MQSLDVLGRAVVSFFDNSGVAVVSAAEIDPPLLAQLSRAFELSTANKRKLFSYWRDVLGPHATDWDAFAHVHISLDMLREVLHSLRADNPKWFRPERNRLRISELILLQAFTKSLRGFRGEWTEMESWNTVSRHYMHELEDVFQTVSPASRSTISEKLHPSSEPLPVLAWKRGLKNVKEVMEDNDEAETAIVLKNISDILKSAAEELKSSNNQIEAFLSAMENTEITKTA
jgi:hypothetical protein